MNTQISEFIKTELDSLSNEISTWHEILNQEAIWLFLATLGCWGVGVESKWFFYSAMGFVLILFVKKAKERHTDNGFFEPRLKNLQKIIEENELLVGDLRLARLYQLNDIKTRQLSIIAVTKRNKVFMGAWLFWAATLAYFMFRHGK